MGARNRLGIGLTYRPARLHKQAEFVSWNWFLGSINVKNTGSELEFLKGLWGLGTEEEEGNRTGPPGHIGWRNSFLGIDSGAPYTFKNTGWLAGTRTNPIPAYSYLVPGTDRLFKNSSTEEKPMPVCRVTYVQYLCWRVSLPQYTKISDWKVLDAETFDKIKNANSTVKPTCSLQYGLCYIRTKLKYAKDVKFS
jgi:hypothetical protein